LTSYISSVGRAASILGWNIFNETPADVKSLIHNSNLGGENINAAVDGSLTKPWPELFSAVTAKG